MSRFRLSAAALLRWLDGLGATELGSAVLGVLAALLGLRDSDSVLDFTRHQSEGLLYIFAILGRGLEEANIKVFSEFLTLFEGDSALFFQVALVADEDARDVVRGVLLDLTHPGLHGRETFSVGDIVGDNDSVGTLVVG